MRAWLLGLAAAIMACAPPPSVSDPAGILLVGNQGAEIDLASGTVLRRLTSGKNGDGPGLAPSPSHR